MVFSCTKKVRDQFKKIRTFDDRGEPKGLHNWYLNEVTLDRKKFLLFTNSLTLFSFLVRASTLNERKKIEQLFETKLREMLIREISSSDIVMKKMLAKPLEYRYTKTCDKTILGSMNDIVQQLKHLCHFDLDKNNEWDYFTHLVNKCPYKALNSKKPIECLKIELGVLRIVR